MVIYTVVCRFVIIIIIIIIIIVKIKITIAKYQENVQDKVFSVLPLKRTTVKYGIDWLLFHINEAQYSKQTCRRLDVMMVYNYK